MIHDAMQFAWPALICAAAWAAAVWVLRQPDEQSRLVNRLTGTGSSRHRGPQPRCGTPDNAHQK